MWGDNEEKKYSVKATCPNCKKVTVFELANKNEKHRFQFTHHDCPKCMQRFLMGWEIRI